MSDDSLHSGPQTNRAFSYLRFSTPEQLKGDSLRRQVDMAQEYARRNGLVLDQDLTFHDIGVSAFRGQNAADGRLAYFLEAVRTGLVPQGSILLVEQLDRVSRLAPRRALRVLEDIVEAGVSVVTLNDERVYTSESMDRDPMDLMISILTFMRANEESATKSRRLKQAWAAKRDRAATKPLTSRVPAWLELDGETGLFRLIPERADVVRRIFAMTLDGCGQHKIAETFNREGLRPWGRGRFWQRSYIAKILANPAVLGIMTPHVMEHDEGRKRRKPLGALEGYYPAVISPETYADVEALRAGERAPSRGRHTVAPISNVLAGMATCPSCGGTMTRVQKGKKSYPALVCSAAKAGAGCAYRSVRYAWVEDAILSRLGEYLNDTPAGDASPELEQEIINADHSVDHLKKQAASLLDNLTYERSPAIVARLREVEQNLEEAEASLAKLLERREATSGPLIAARVEKLRVALSQDPLDRAVINTALRGIFKRAVINWPNASIDFEWTHGGEFSLQYAWAPWGGGRKRKRHELRIHWAVSQGV